jgi:curved DNA-binding protein CbpA
MRSAYLVLGVPGNATPEEIEQAFRTAEHQFPRERLAEEEGALGRMGEIRNAYKVLRDPESRAAHDRKLQETARPRPRPRTVIVESDEPSPARRMLLAGVLLAAVLFGAAGFINWRTAQTRKEEAAIQLATQKVAAEAAEQKRLDDERQAQLRTAQAKQAELNERRLAMESRYSAANAAAVLQSQEFSAANARRTELYEQQRRESSRVEEERRAAYEARMRTESDKARIRALCLQNYHRVDC